MASTTQLLTARSLINDAITETQNENDSNARTKCSQAHTEVLDEDAIAEQLNVADALLGATFVHSPLDPDGSPKSDPPIEKIRAMAIDQFERAKAHINKKL